MLEWKSWPGLASILAVLLVSTACCTVDAKSAAQAKANEDIQERLSAAISRNGFSHALRSERGNGRHNDAIYIEIPLDNLKRRHYSLENMLRDVGRVCALPEYGALAIRVEFAAGDHSDRLYLQELFLREVADRNNIGVGIESNRYSDIVISTSHPDAKAR